MKALISLFLFVPSSFVFGQFGALDNSFGIGGKVTTDLWGNRDISLSIAIQNDGKLVAAGYSGTSSWGSYDFALVRYNRNGSLDNAFGTAGKITTGIGIYDDFASSVALQTDGKIVVTGFSMMETKSVFSLVRYNSDGSIDNTFGSGGKVTTAVGVYDDRGSSVAIQDDGKILVGGRTNNGSYRNDFVMIRYNSDGTLDNTFGFEGKVITDVGYGDNWKSAIAIQADGKIIMAGTGNWLFTLVRYHTDGAVDSAFGAGGMAAFGFGGEIEGVSSVDLQNDGKIVVSGSTWDGLHNDFALVRCHADGTIDNTFGSAGRIITNMDDSGGGRSAAIQSDGKIVVAGYIYTTSYVWDFALIRYNSDGSLDHSFGSDGLVTTDFGGNDVGHSIVMQPGGEIVVAGNYYNGSGNDFAIARYTSGTVGAGELKEIGNGNIYPNPGSGIFTLDLGNYFDAQIYIYDVLGNCMFNRNYGNDEIARIDLSIQQRGIYYIEIVSDSKRSVNKIVLQ